MSNRAVGADQKITIREYGGGVPEVHRVAHVCLSGNKAQPTLGLDCSLLVLSGWRQTPRQGVGEGQEIARKEVIAPVSRAVFMAWIPASAER